MRNVPDIEIERAGAKRGHHDERLRDAADQLQERNREDVKADVVPEDRILLAERHRLPPRHPRFPLRRGVERDQPAEHHRDRRCDRPKLLAAGQCDLHALLRREDRPAFANEPSASRKIEHEPQHGDDEA